MSAKQDPFKATEKLLEEVGIVEPSQKEKPQIKHTAVISELAEKVGMALGKAPHKLFLRGDTVMKIEYDPTQDALDFVPMRESEFVTWAERWVQFGREKEVEGDDDDGDDSKKKKKWIQSSLQQKTAKLILDSPQFRGCLPRVVRKNRVRLPIRRAPSEGFPQGRVELLPIGFDEESGVYTFPNEIVIDEGMKVGEACSHFMDLYGEFPLPLVTVEHPDGEKETRQCPRALGVCVAGPLAAFAEGLLPAHTLRCGFIYTANSSGSGKSLLAKMAIAPITGQAAGLTLAKDEESLRNRVDSLLLSGQSCIFFDNVKGYVESSVIEGLMTLPYWQGRTYHTQKIFTVKNETTIFLTGNNASVSPDINRRFLYVELFLETADPRDRKITREIDDHWLVATGNRSKIVSALWCLVKHWDAKGRPGAPTSIAGFRAWCDVIGGIVCAASEECGGAIGNPLVQPELSSSGDKETKHVKRMVELMIADGRASGRVVNGEVVTSRSNFEFESHELLELAMANGLFDWFLPDLPEGKEIADVIKQPERVRFGRLITAKSGEHPRGMKYAVKEGEKVELWRFSYKGSGRHRRYMLDLE